MTTRPARSSSEVLLTSVIPFWGCLHHLPLSETCYRRLRLVSMKTEPARSSSESCSPLSFLLGLLGLISRLYQRAIVDQDLSSLTTEPARSSSKSVIGYSAYGTSLGVGVQGSLLEFPPLGPGIYFRHLQGSSWHRSAAIFQVYTSRRGWLLRRGSRKSTRVYRSVASSENPLRCTGKEMRAADKGRWEKEGQDKALMSMFLEPVTITGTSFLCIQASGL